MLDEEAVMRAAVKYGRALNRGIELADYIRKVNEAAGRDYEIELSVDETDQPTTLAEHYIIADQCLGRGMKLVSLAPRFVGTLEKGVDYIGDVRGVREVAPRSPGDRRIAGPVQAEPALRLGQALDLPGAGPGDRRPVPREDGRHVVPRSAARRGPARSAAVPHDLRVRPRAVRRRQGDLPRPRDARNGRRRRPRFSDDHQLEQLYLECWEDVPDGAGFTAPGRQILHCTFGSVLTTNLGRAVRDARPIRTRTPKSWPAFREASAGLQAGC